MAAEADQAGAWTRTNQHAASRDALFYAPLVNRSAFDQLVTFAPADMNHVDSAWHGKFDFVWSTCSLEHVGSISLGHRYRDAFPVTLPCAQHIFTS